MAFYDLPDDKTFLFGLKAVIIKDGEALVLHSASKDQRWELPGGFVEIEEGLFEGLAREVREETSLEVSVINNVLVLWDSWTMGFRFRDGSVRDARVIGVVYECQLVSGEVKLSDEHDESRWVTPQELSEISHFILTEERVALERQFYRNSSKERL